MKRLIAVGSSALLAVSVLAAPGASALAARARPHAPAKPVVTAVRANRGATVGFTHVIISGSNFTGTPKVVFGHTAAVNVRVLSSHRLVAYAPGHRHGTVQVRVRTKAGTSPTSNDSRYTYVHQVTPGTWQASTAPVPSGEPADDFVGLSTSCPTTSACYSVGVFGPASDDASPTGPLVSSRVDGKVTTEPAPLPSGVKRANASLDTISCPAVGSCAATGSYANGRHGLLLVLANGTWTVGKADLHEGTGMAEIDDLSCGAPGECAAVGYQYDSSHNEHSPVLLRLHDGTWTTKDVVPPGRNPGRTELDAIDCASASYCLAAGSYGGGTRTPGAFVVEVVDGAQTVRRIPNSPRDGEATGAEVVQCPAVGRCTVLVDFANADSPGGEDATDFVSVVNGSHFAFRPITYPADADSLTLFAYNGSMSCPSVSVCYAANDYEIRGSYVAAVARMDGSKVHFYPLPRPAGKPNARSIVNDIDCASTTACTAVGEASANGAASGLGAYFTLADGVWAPEISPKAPGQKPRPTRTDYTSVECPAAGACVANGDYEWDYKYGPDEDGFYYHYYVKDSGLVSLETPN